MMPVLIVDAAPWDQLNACAAILAAAVAVTALFVTRSWSKFHKNLDITMKFQEAYATLEVEKAEVKSVIDADSWFRRYWNLQIRQYEYWLHDYIPDEIYVYWMQCNKGYCERPRGFVVHDSNAPPRATAYSYLRGWETVRTDLIFKEHPYHFQHFIDRMLAHEQKDTFARAILETKKDLFGWPVRLDRLTDRIIRDDPRKSFRLREHKNCPSCDASVNGRLEVGRNA